ncbi:MAG TPA: patatin-like phospholipase family protein [Pyrinomonadaceae bacterium]|nr:patatin-like phospholipase family protein [Pyrinomonadaceae bacterium]
MNIIEPTPTITEAVAQPAPAPVPERGNKAFGEIALSLSGGGYRAAAFHLGVLDMLHRLGIMQEVRVLSTVSGGTFTGMAYAVSILERETFEAFYQRVYGFLKDTHVIKRALDNLSSGDTTAPEQMPSLIRSAAQVYASDEMFGDRRLDQLLNSSEPSHLTDIIFNAVEFRHGISFRFQTSRSGSGVIGNGELVVSDEVSRDIRLADIAAASSCFPAAFEPLRFPDDFRWPDRRTLEEARQNLSRTFQTECVPLMDGGIFDNQGLDSVVNVYKRTWNSDGKKPDLFIISDTSQRSESLLKFPPKKRTGWLSLRAINVLAWILFALALMSSISLPYYGYKALPTSPFDLLKWVLVFAVPFVVSALIAGGLYWLRARVGEALSLAQEKTDIELWPYLKLLKVPELIALVDDRLRSLITLATSVFMKRIRDMGYEDISVYPKYAGKLRFNVLYDMDNETKYGAEVIRNHLEPSMKLRQLAKDAEKIGTNLWFTDEENLKKLVACGQATTCFNILRFILRKKSNPTDEADRTAKLADPNSALRGVYDEAFKLWGQLNEDPRALLNE